VYCASSPDLANREYLAGFVAAGLPVHKAMPLTGKAIAVELSLMLDLLDPAVLARLGIETEEIHADPWRRFTDRGEESLCQGLGRAAWKAGVEAIRAPSVCCVDATDFGVVLIMEVLGTFPDKWRILNG